MTSTWTGRNDRLKIALINQPVGNRGDQAAHKALIRLLQQQGGIETTVLFLAAPAAVRQFAHDQPGVRYVTIAPFRRSRKILRRTMYLPSLALRPLERIPEVHAYNDVLREADYVLCAPGGICMGGYKNWQHIWELANALALRKRTGIYGRSIGPFDIRCFADRVFRRRSVQILRRVDYLSLRDAFSQQLAEELGIAYVPTVDTAFACRPDGDLPSDLLFLQQRPYAVLVPNQLCAWHPSFQALAPERLDDLYRSMLHELLACGLDVVMMPQLFDQQSDRPYFVRLAEGLDEARVLVLPDCHDSDVQQRVVRGARLVVGARYHSIVFAINNDRPFLCLSYEHKMLHMLKLLDLEACALSLEHLMTATAAREEVRSALQAVLRDERRTRPRIEEAHRKAEDLAHQSFARFVARLG